MFQLYGPIKSGEPRWPNPYDKIILYLAGDKIIRYIDRDSETQLLDLQLNTLRTVRYKYKYMYYSITIHHPQSVPTTYFAGAVDRSDCPYPLGVFYGCEIEYYKHREEQVNVICVFEDARESMPGRIYYDAVKDAFIIDSLEGYGNTLFMIRNGYVKKWKPGYTLPLSHNIALAIYDDDTLYVIIKHGPQYKYQLEIRKYDVEEFYENFGKPFLDNYGEQVYVDVSADYEPIHYYALTLAPLRRFISMMNINGNESVLIDPETGDSLRTIPINAWIIGKYGIHRDDTDYYSTKISIQDIESLTTHQEITLPQSNYPLTYFQVVDPIFVPVANWASATLDIYLLTYKGVAPVIEYDHVNRKIRVVDFITKNPVRAELWVWRSRFCYPRNAFPLGIQPETISVSDWTPVPSAYRNQCLTFAIKEVSE
ncbi:MAG: hypothetical protein QXK07_04090 [Desulfurococcaceae archaeon]